MSQNFEDSVQNIKRTILNHNKAMPQPKNQRVIKFDVAQNVHNVHPIQQHALPSKFLKISSNYRIRCVAKLCQIACCPSCLCTHVVERKQPLSFVLLGATQNSTKKKSFKMDSFCLLKKYSGQQFWNTSKIFC